MAAERLWAPPIIAQASSGRRSNQQSLDTVSFRLRYRMTSRHGVVTARRAAASPLRIGRAQVNQRCSAAAGLSRRMWGEGPAGIAVQAHTACAVEA